METTTLIGLDVGSVNVKCVVLSGDGRGASPRETWCRPAQGRPLEVVQEILAEAMGRYGDRARVGVTGAGRSIVTGGAAVARVNEVVAVAAAVAASHPQVRTIIDIGGQFTKWILVDGRELSRRGRVQDFALNGLCAAGSGAFLEQQAGRLKLDLAELGRLAATAERGATIAGRCSVFAKSDMIHLQQKGTPVAEIAYGLCLALARTFVATVLKGRRIEAPVALVGGGAANEGLVRAFGEVLGLEKGEVFVPEDHLTLGARGAALGGVDASPMAVRELLGQLDGVELKVLDAVPVGGETPVELAPLRGALIAEEARPTEDPGVAALPATGPIRAFMGIDVGSVSTNVVLVDEAKHLLLGLYLPTRGRPVEVLAESLALLVERFKDRLEVIGVGTTGSGRYLAAQLLGADLVKNEITAQLVSAAHYVPEVDTVFEIGGQDSKYIDAQGGRLRDFEMNKICAAGTGSFLEEQAERLGVAIKGEFAALALEGPRPRDLGSRCTVFMDAELCRSQAQGAPLTDLCAGLAYSVARNYLDKVVAGRPVGRTVVFQGGTASNRAVVAAFSRLLGREVKVHPYNRISGALGVALLAAREMERRPGDASAFLGLDAVKDHETRSFECRHCENRCQVIRVKAGGRTAHFGDVCERFTSLDRAGGREARAVPNRRRELFGARADLLEAYLPQARRPGRPRMGLVRASLGLELLPLWTHLLDQLGFEPVVSPPSNPELLRRGVPGLPSEVCLPVKLTAGHVRYLLGEMGVDRVFLPSVLELAPVQPRDRSFSCVFAQQIPDMTAGSLSGQLIAPQIPFSQDPGATFERVSALATALQRSLGDVERALGFAMQRQQAFSRARRSLGEEALASLPERAVVVLGKPYNLHDPFTNLNLAKHLERLGLAAIPMDCLPLEEEILDQAWYLLPWHYNREQLRAVSLTSRHRELFPVWVSSFGCGPDGFSVKHLEHVLGDRPRLLMEFDEHRGEAGLVTRLEAFADEITEHQREHHAPVPLRPRIHRSVIERPRTTNRRVFLPGFSGHAHAFAGLLRRVGYETVILPPPDDEALRLGEEFTSGRECHPYTILAGELVRLSRSGKVRRGDIFYTPGTRNPCLLLQYGDGFRKVLDTLGDTRITVWDPHAGELQTVLGMDAMSALYQGLTLVDWLMVAAGFYRPWERLPGAIDRALEECVVDVEETMATSGDMRDALIRGFARLDAVPLHPRDDRPIIGITGDLYSRVNPAGNGLLVYKLEAMGCVTWLSPFFGATPDFEWPQVAERSAARGELGKSLVEYGGAVLMLGVQRHLAAALPDWIADRCREPPYAVLQNSARRYVSEHTNHLVRGIVAKMVDFSHRGASGVISAIGLGCMVGITATSAIPAIRADHDDVPIVCLAYGGHEGPAQKIQLETFVHQVKQFHASRRTDR